MRLVDALRRVLSPEIEAGEFVVKDYEADFDDLWGQGEGLHGTVVLVWSDTPPGDAFPITTAPYVSPIHWAIRTADQAARKGLGFLCTIVDLRPRNRNEIPLHALLRETGATGWPPWLRLVVPTELAVADRAELKQVLVPRPSPRQPSDSSLDLLIDQVSKHLTDPGERDSRHGLANILGPMILLGHIPARVPPSDGRSARHREALRELLNLSRLLSRHDDPIETELDILDAGTRLFLLDDQWHHGWGEWLCTILGVQFEAPTALDGGPQRISANGSRVEVFALQNPDWLLGKLRYPSTPFQLTLGPDERPGQEILLLDLRLFAEKEAAERRFQESIRDSCRPYLDQQPGFSAEDLEAEATSAKSRALLGRLLALKDLSFPAILFSSTSDRSYVREFEHCPNVITSFAKPGRPGQRFDGAQRDTTAPAFFAALREARKLCDARDFVRQIFRWAEKGRDAAQALALRQPRGDDDVDQAPRPLNWSHVELYLDESSEHDKPKFRAGGYIVLYESEEKARNGLRFSKKWGFSRDFPFSRNAPPAESQWTKAQRLRGQASIDEVLAELRTRADLVQDCAGAIGAGVAACILHKGTASEASIPGPDATYRALATSAIELFLFDWLPALETAWSLKRCALGASIFVGTRQVPTRDPSELIQHQWRFGLPFRAFQDSANPSVNVRRLPGMRDRQLEPLFGFSGPDEILEVPAPRTGATHSLFGVSISPADAYSMIVGALHQRANSDLSDRLRSAVAVTLYDYGKPSPYHLEPPRLPRQAHFATDDLLGSSELWSEPPIQRALDAGFQLAYGGALEIYLRASRAFDAGDMPRCLTELQRAHKAAAPECILRWLALRMQNELRAIKPEDYIQFARGVVVLRTTSKTVRVTSSKERKPRSAVRDTPLAQVMPTAELRMSTSERRTAPQPPGSMALPSRGSASLVQEAEQVAWVTDSIRAALSGSGHEHAARDLVLVKIARDDRSRYMLVATGPTLAVKSARKAVNTQSVLTSIKAKSIHMVQWSGSSELAVVQSAYSKWRVRLKDHADRIEVAVLDRHDASDELSAVSDLVEVIVGKRIVVTGG